MFDSKGFAACKTHSVSALVHMAGGKSVRIREVTGRNNFTCECGAPADYFLIEYDAAQDQASPTYTLMLAVSNLLGTVSSGVHKRIRRAYDANTYTSFPGVDPKALVELVDALNAISPGAADRVIAAVRAAEKKSGGV